VVGVPGGGVAAGWAAIERIAGVVNRALVSPCPWLVRKRAKNRQGACVASLHRQLFAALPASKPFPHRGDQTGSQSDPGLLVRLVCCEPSAFIT
jgi:hypothetical protein